MSAEAPTLVTGQTIDGKYDIVRQLGQGGMGAVYEAIHRGTSRRVALKVIVSAALAKEDGVLARFQREARASGSIDSAHVVQVLDTGVEPETGNPYMVMEYLSGEDVHDLIRRLGPLQPSLALRIVAQACLGLQRAHEAGIIHRDIKSANMYLARRDGGEMTLKLLDFGIAKVRADGFAANDDQHLTRTGSLLGSPLFMSPEQARGMKNLDGRADLWSLGVVLYQALTGRTPNDDKETLGDLIIAICTEDAPPVQQKAPWVSPELSAIVARALSRDLNTRYASAKEMHDALAALSPSGIGLREEMLVSLSDTMRAQVAVLNQPTVLTPRQVVHTPVPFGDGSSPLASTHAAPEGSYPPGPISGNGQAITGGQMITGGGPMATGGGTTPGAQSSKRALKVMLVAAAAVVGIGGVGAAFFAKSSAGKGAGAGMVAATASSASVSAQPEPHASTSASTVLPVPRTVSVTIVAPPDARAELDGAPVTVENGAIAISGAVGSLHKVRLALGDASQETAVTILESGAALPGSIELKAPAKPLVGAKSVAQTPASSASAPPKPKPAAAPPVTAAPPPTEPSVKRTF